MCGVEVFHNAPYLKSYSNGMGLLTSTQQHLTSYFFIKKFANQIKIIFIPLNYSIVITITENK